MLSFARTNPSLLFAAQLLFVLLCLLRPAHGGSVRAHRLRGSESDPPRAPNADMLKALEFIENLRQRTDSQERARPPAGGGLDDAQEMRSMLRLNEDEGKDVDEESEDKSEELLQAVLSTLQQTEKASKPTLLHPSSLGGGRVKQQSIMPHKKMPLMFEDEEEGEGEEEDDEHGSPFKRTNENVEEKYTPQNLATLQSIFDELDKFTTEKMAHKRQDEEKEDEEDMFHLRNVAYDDEGEELADWGPMEEQDDEEEEEENKEELDRSLDYVDDEEDEGYPMKRSDAPDEVDYYLFKVLEKTEEEEQKRAIEEEEEEEEEEREERGVAQYRGSIDPQVIYQLIHPPQTFKMPPPDLLQLLKTKHQSDNKLWQTSSRSSHKGPTAPFLHRRPSFRQSGPGTPQREELLNILGLGDSRNRGQASVRKPHSSRPSRLRTLPAGRAAAAAPAPRRFPPGKPSEYDGATADRLAAYLAAQMLARYPGPAHRYSQKREEAGQSVAGSFERAMQDYLDRMDSGGEADDEKQTEDAMEPRSKGV
ncbi:secretogranin-2a [Dunckerocampus dactyliophorus]|uniref:secretogranin-2a n=1 Tax=Dunckerocampus dactyliophorus TaxID=161453 RepID=UPI0024064B23|nr:secretogranin-2a [Dunckerocampus dactyliophorus]XP_054650602.1 secretogranin-2a [Dunckerocampus dactyliophorus]